MEVRVLTLRYSPKLGAIDDAPLTNLGRDHEVLAVREHFFIVHDVPHLLCVVSCQPRAAMTTAATLPAPGSTPESEAPAPAEPSPPSTPDPGAGLSDDQRRLFDAIRRWRVTQAEHDGVPRYVVLTNRNVEALVRERPETLAALLRIEGIGKTKVERYGEALLALLHPRPAAPTEAARTEVAPTPQRVNGPPGPAHHDTPAQADDEAARA